MTTLTPHRRFAQPITAPGPRLLESVPLDFVRTRSRCVRRAVSQELPLVPFIDFLLCIVLFLLASFSATGEIPLAEVDLPTARHVSSLLEAPVVSIGKNAIMVDGEQVGSVREILERGGLQRVEGVGTMLRKKAELWRSLNPTREFPGAVSLAVDRDVPAVVVKSVFQTAAMAGYPNVAFIVNRAGGDVLPVRD